MKPAKTPKPAPSKDATESAAALAQLTCLLCKQQYPLTEMSSHLARIHADYLPHKCLHCDYFSVSALEMGQHGMESKHRVVINEAPDDYKADFVNRLLADCWKKTNGEAPIPTLTEQIVKTEPALKIEVDQNEKSEGRGEAAGTSGPKQVLKGQVAKAAALKSITCQLPGCGAELKVSGKRCDSSKTRHIEVHVKAHNGFDFLCPVDGCRKSGSQQVKAESGNVEYFKCFDALEMHVKKFHNLTPKQKASFEALKTRVKESVSKLRYECFPPSGRAALAIYAKKMKAAKVNAGKSKMSKVKKTK